MNKHWYGISFDGNKFVAFVLRGNVVVKAYECYWTSKGSKEFLVEFIEKSLDNWTKCLNRLCDDLGVTVPYPTFDETMFLGRGAFGRVVKVLDSFGLPKALKLTLCDSESKRKCFRREFETIMAADNDSGNVVDVVGDSFRQIESEEISFCGYLMELGQTLTKEYVRANIATTFRELFNLHSRLISHGDPRVANLILVGDKLKWIDFRGCLLKGTPVAFKDDLKIFISSTFGPEVYHIPHVQGICESYFEREDGNDCLIEELIQIVSALNDIL